jgi:Fur family transcriptional regulator, iron response regulator
MKPETIIQLEQNGVRPSAQRVAIAEYVLHTDCHPSADEVWQQVKARFPLVSRATVYNTLQLFVHQGLLRELALSDDAMVYDPVTAPHHHFIDEGTGAIHDVPWDAVKVSRVDGLAGFEVREYQVVMRGRKKRR